MDNDTYSNILNTVQLMTDDLNKNMNFESFDSKYYVFKQEHPKIFNMVKSDPNCIIKLQQIQQLRINKEKKGLSQYDASAAFGQSLADEYLTPKET